MLNALIALTGETFTEIFAAQVPSGYKEKVYQIVIMQNSLGFLFKHKPDANERLFVAERTISSLSERVGPSTT